METKIYTITDPEKDHDKIAEAAEILRNGGLVAFPDGYGLCGRRFS